MPQAGTIKSLPRAFRIMESMQAQGIEWGEDYRRAGARGPPVDYGDKLVTEPKWPTFALPHGPFLLRRLQEYNFEYRSASILPTRLCSFSRVRKDCARRSSSSTGISLGGS